MGARLVRDGITDRKWHFEELKKFLRPIASRQEHEALLEQKLLEELGEMLTAESFDATVDEAADLLEVLETWLTVRAGASPVDVYWRQREKYKAAGGFHKGTVYDNTMEVPDATA